MPVFRRAWNNQKNLFILGVKMTVQWRIAWHIICIIIITIIIIIIIIIITVALYSCILGFTSVTTEEKKKIDFEVSHLEVILLHVVLIAFMEFIHNNEVVMWFIIIIITIIIIINPLTPVPPITARDETWAFFLFWRHHLWPKLASSILNFCRRKDLSNDAQIRVIGRMEPYICRKMTKKLSEKLRAKFNATTPGCSMVKIARLDDAFSKVF